MACDQSCLERRISKGANLVGELTHSAGDDHARHVRRRTLLKLPLVATVPAALSLAPRAVADPGPWSPERAHTWYRAQGWLVGANYITSTAINQLEMFQPDTYDARRIDGELRLARLIGLNTVRVFLHDQLWTQDRQGFQRRLAQFVRLADRHGIKPLFVLFDSCWDPIPKLGPQRAPRPGIHNSGWVQSPGAERLDDRRYIDTMRDYVVGVMTQFRDDKRVLGWDLWNEPDNPADQYRRVERRDKLDLVAELLPQVFRWARSVNASQPLTSGVWDGEWADARRRTPIVRIQLDNSDVISFHSYAEPEGFERRIAELAPLGRPILCTEYMARSLGSTVQTILPIMQRHNIAAYNWGFITGKTQTNLPWDSWDHPYTTPPDEWFHDLVYPGGRPYREEEIHTIRKLTGKLAPAAARPDANWRTRRAKSGPR
jgi:hypothetical protein